VCAEGSKTTRCPDPACSASSESDRRRTKFLINSDLSVRIIIPLISPLVAAVAVYFAVKTTTDEFQRKQAAERESIMRSVVGVSLYAESTLKIIQRRYVETNFAESKIPQTAIDGYKSAVALLCETVYSEYSVNYLFFSLMRFVDDDDRGDDSYDFLAENCVRSANLVFDEQSESGISRQTVNLDRLSDVRKLFLFLKTIRYFFDNDDCYRISIYKEIQMLAVAIERGLDDSEALYLIGDDSSAWGDVPACIEDWAGEPHRSVSVRQRYRHGLR